jgi:hypothetical protein
MTEDEIKKIEKIIKDSSPKIKELLQEIKKITDTGTSPENFKKIIKDVNLKTLDETLISFILLLFIKNKDVTQNNKIGYLYHLIDNPKGGIDINTKINFDPILLYFIVENRLIEFKYLVERHSSDLTVKTVEYLLKKCTEDNQFKFAEILVANVAKIDYEFITNLMKESIEFGQVELFEILLKDGLINRQERIIYKDLMSILVIESIKFYKPEMAEILLKNGADVNGKVDGYGFMNRLIKEKFNDVLEFYELFVRYGIDIDQEIKSLNWYDGYTTLCSSISKQDESRFNFCIDNGADVNKEIFDNRTGEVETVPLTTAVLVKTTYIKKLIDKGANVNYIFPKKTVYHRVKEVNVKFNKLSILQYFVLFGRYRESKDIIKLLLDSGADKDHKETTTNKTALEFAKDEYKNTDENNPMFDLNRDLMKEEKNIYMIKIIIIILFYICSKTV